MYITDYPRQTDSMERSSIYETQHISPCWQTFLCCLCSK